MKKLAAFVVSGYGQAVFCIVVFAGLAFVIPVASIFSGAALGLFTFSFGYRQALFVMIVSALTLSGLFWVSNYFSDTQLHSGGAWMFLILQWLPVTVLAQLVRVTQSLSILFQACAVFAVLTVLGVFLLVPDSSAMWADFLRSAFQGETDALLSGSSDLVEQYNNILLKLMTGFVVSSILLFWVASVLLAYWWQCLMTEPGGFKKSFTGIELSKVAAAFGLAAVLIAVLSENSTITEMVIVLTTVFLFQGIAAAHFLLSRLNEGKIFLFLFYGALVLSPLLPILPSLIGIFGMLESFMNLRNRSRRSDMTA